MGVRLICKPKHPEAAAEIKAINAQSGPSEAQKMGVLGLKSSAACVRNDPSARMCGKSWQRSRRVTLLNGVLWVL